MSKVKVLIAGGASSLSKQIMESLGDDYEIETGPIKITKGEEFPDFILPSDHLNDPRPHNKKGGRRKW